MTKLSARFQRIAERPTRDELWGTCPFGFTGPKKDHAWLETTLPGDPLRTFGCDCCEARAAEQMPAGGRWS